jgi:large subunit ribosomal protein L2
MPIKTYNPYTPARRTMADADFSDLDKVAPQRKLTTAMPKTGGRNNYGHITSRFRGGGHKQRYRVIDFRREKLDIPAKVATIEYDPNRSARIALLEYADGDKRYILAPAGLERGMTVMSGSKAEIKPGNALPLRDIPPGIPLHCIELRPGRGASMVRTAGGQATIRAKEGDYAQVKLPSGEIRMIGMNCMATIGVVGNADHMARSMGKAGKKRYLGKRPHNRGVVMNPVDHPMGGGEGRTSGGGHPRSPWGQLAKGFRTRKKKKNSSKFIVERRKK